MTGQPRSDEPGEPVASGVATQDGLTLRRAWPVWANETQHRVDVALNAMTGSVRVLVDGDEVARRSAWHMNMSGFELPFEVGDRPCLLVVRHRYGAQAEMELYSEGRSLSTGEPLAAKRAAETREIPNLVRMLLIFIPLIGAGNTVLLRPQTVSGILGGWGPWLLIGAGIAFAGAGWWLASRWYARGPAIANRHLVGGAIVAGAWIAFFVAFVALLSLKAA